jgi:hypothetical protein
LHAVVSAALVSLEQLPASPPTSSAVESAAANRNPENGRPSALVIEASRLRKWPVTSEFSCDRQKRRALERKIAPGRPRRVV